MNPVIAFRRLQKKRNKRLIQWEMARGRVDVATVPYDINFNPENRCQLDCIMCANAAERGGKGAVPALRRLRALEQTIPCWSNVQFTGTGETLLCPDLIPMIETARRHGVHTSFATNGLLLRRRMAERLVRSRVDDIVISVDAGTPQTYEKIRRGARWADLVRGIETLNRARAERGGDRPRLILSGNFARYNIEELPAFVDFAAHHRAAVVYVIKTLFFEEPLKQHDLSHCPDLVRAAVAAGRDRAQRAGIEFGDWLSVPEPSAAPGGNGSRPAGGPHTTLACCSRPWTSMRVNHDGIVRFCCGEGNIIGNLDEEPFHKIWNGAPARTLRRLFLQDRLPDGCRRCAEMTGKTDLETADSTKAVTERPGYLATPLEGETISGVVKVNGWIVNPAPVERVEVRVDDRGLARASCRLERPDVVRIHPRCSPGQRPGFSARLDTRELENGYHLLHLGARGAGGETREMFHRTVRVEN